MMKHQQKHHIENQLSRPVVIKSSHLLILRLNTWVITLLNMHVSFCGPSDYNSEMLEKLSNETRIQIELQTSHCYILRVHVAK
jgi:hypothetical protein